MNKPTMSDAVSREHLDKLLIEYYEKRDAELTSLADGMAKMLEIFEMQGSDETEALRDYVLWRINN